MGRLITRGRQSPDDFAAIVEPGDNLGRPRAQCVSWTIRSLADESFAVTVLEDACAAGTEALHRQKLEIINMIYCHVIGRDELLGYLS